MKEKKKERKEKRKKRKRLKERFPAQPWPDLLCSYPLMFTSPLFLPNKRKISSNFNCKLSLLTY